MGKAKSFLQPAATKDNNLVSVIMPLFNHEKYVARAIESILAQTHKNFELIIIDDGSVDNSAKVAQHYAKQDKRIKYHYQKNQGVAMARNIGLKMARGQYVAWQDADDYSHKERLARQLNFLQKNKNIGAIGTWLQPVDAKGINLAPPEVLAAERTYQTAMDKIKYLIGGKEYGYANLPSFMVDKKWATAVGGFRNLRVGEDMDFIFRVEEKTAAATIQQPLYYYRHHGNNSEARLARAAGPKNKSKRLEIAIGNLVYFLSAYARRIHGRDPIGHLPQGTPLARVRHLRYFIFYPRVYRFVPRILRLNKMSIAELLVRLLLNQIPRRHYS